MLRFNIHNDQDVVKSAIQKLIQPYPAGSYPISCCHGTMCNSIFLIANIKHLQFPDYSFCCGCICRNNQVQEKIVQSLSVFLMAKIDFLSSGLSFFYRTRVQSLFTLVTDLLSNRLTH